MRIGIKKSSIMQLLFTVILLTQLAPLFPQATADTIVYVTKTGDKYHIAGCRYLSKSMIPMSLSEASLRYSPCSVCKPPILASVTRQPAPAQSTPPPTMKQNPISNTFTGKVVAITDGDTLKVMREGKEVTIRLNGIDAPESSQAFGQRAKQMCSEYCFGKTVTVIINDTDRYGRLVADIQLPDGLILNRELVRHGMAWHYKQYSNDITLATLEEAARNNRYGLWADKAPVAPWEYRK